MIPYLINYEKFLKRNIQLIRNPNLHLIQEQDFSFRGIYIKHDVECKLDKAVAMSNVESNNGVSSIWLLQKSLLIDRNIPVLKKMISKGHIIGYHYDVLDSNDGNYDAALIEFNEIVSWFTKNLCDLAYVCPHGNPSKIRVGYQSNKDFWIKYSYKFDSIFDLVVDYDGPFFSDVSYGFYKISRNISDKNIEKKQSIDFQKYEYQECSLISIHSHRWSPNIIISFYNYLQFKTVKLIYNQLKGYKLIKALSNKFYFLTKNI